MRTLSLISASDKPCGVESFARGLAERLATRDGVSSHGTFVLRGETAELAAFPQELATYDALVVSLPVVAWKKQIVSPARAMWAARRAGKQVILVLHEWADLDWKRRATYAPYLPLATRILFSSPLVRRQFEMSHVAHLATGHRGLVPIPPNLACPIMLPETDLVRRVRRLKADGAFVLGHFGAIYPKKQSIAVLDMAAAMKAKSRKVHTVFIGDFIGGSTVDPKGPFQARMKALDLEQDVTITGYIGPAADVFAGIAACDALAYVLPEGLTSRRGSVLAGLQTKTPVIVNAPRHGGEFDHHPTFRRALDGGHLVLLDAEATPEAFADALLTVTPQRVAPVRFTEAWQDVVDVVALPEQSARQPVAGSGYLPMPSAQWNERR
jgi:glycosyltransferase involved in cell wall biosynthesis